MSKTHVYRCSECGERQWNDPPGVIGGKTAQQKIMLKRVVFVRPGPFEKGKTSGKFERARTVANLCEKCLSEDPSWNLDPLAHLQFLQEMNARALDERRREQQARMIRDAIQQSETPADPTDGVPEAT